MNEEPQVKTTYEMDKLTVSAELKIQSAPYESVGAFRSYSQIIKDGDDLDQIERNLIERAIGVSSLTVDLMLAVNYKKEPRYQHVWSKFSNLCPDKFKVYLGLDNNDIKS